jgi:hypothetical protein
MAGTERSLTWRLPVFCRLNCSSSRTIAIVTTTAEWVLVRNIVLQEVIGSRDQACRSYLLFRIKAMFDIRILTGLLLIMPSASFYLRRINRQHSRARGSILHYDPIARNLRVWFW